MSRVLGWFYASMAHGAVAVQEGRGAAKTKKGGNPSVPALRPTLGPLVRGMYLSGRGASGRRDQADKSAGLRMPAAKHPAKGHPVRLKVGQEEPAVAFSSN